MTPALPTSPRPSAVGPVPGRCSRPGTAALRAARPAPRARPGPAALAAAVLALGAWLPACRAASADARAPRLPGTTSPRERRPVLPAPLLPALEALRAAVVDGEDETAEAILAGLRARAPADPEVERLLAGFERVLEGRRLVRSLDLALRLEPATPSAPRGDGAEPRAGGPAGAPAVPRFRLVLDASHGRPEPLTLRLPPATLERLVVALDPRGLQTKSFETRNVPELSELTLAPGAVRSLTLLDYELSTGAALAAREEWRLRLHSGSVAAGEAELPASRIASATCEHVVLAPFLPAAPVEPEVLAAYVQRDEVWLPALLERTVRIAPGRRVEALELLLPVVEGLARERPERIDELAPALSWLLRVTEGGDGVLEALRSRAWGDGGEGGPLDATPDRRGGLELPDRPRGGPAPAEGAGRGDLALPGFSEEER